MTISSDHPGVSTLAGTPKEVQAQLTKFKADHVLVVAFEHVEASAQQALVENLTNVASSMFGVFQHRQERQSLEQLAIALLPRAPVSPLLLKEAAMLVQARRAVLDSGNWLTAAEVAQVAGLSTNNPSAQPNKWKKSGQIFAIHHNGTDYFPDYGLDHDSSFRPLKALAKVIEVFADHKDAWGMAFWFLADNSMLGAERPQDVLASDPERVIAAALDEVQGVRHG